LRYFLSRLQVEGFRGINNEGLPLDLRLDPAKLTTVFAPNGAGKSSTFDALRYAITGCIPRLDSLHADEEASAFYNNVFHSTGTATIDLELTPESGGASVSIRVTRSADGRRTVSGINCPIDPSRFLAALEGEAVFVDAATFASFVDDSPLRRGRSFASLVGLSSLSGTRQALEVLANTRTLNGDFELQSLRARRAERAATVNRLDNTARAQYEARFGIPLSAPLTSTELRHRIRDRLSEEALLVEHVAQMPQDTIDFPALREVIRSAEGGPDRERLIALTRDLTRLRGLQQALVGRS
jgi:hypothetical protein